MPKKSFISLSPSCTEILCALGLENQIEAASEEGLRAGASGLNLGPAKALDLDRLWKTGAETIFMAEAENRPDQIQQIRAERKVFVFKVSSVEDCLKVVLEIGRIAGTDSPAQELVNKICAEKKLCIHPEPKPRSILLLADNPFITVNRNTYASSLLETAGAENFFADDPIPEFAVELEDILDARPDLLILAGAPYGFREKHVLHYRAFNQLAGQEVVCLDGFLLSRFGPRTLQALRELRRMIQASKNIPKV